MVTTSGAIVQTEGDIVRALLEIGLIMHGRE
jgi:hypothetical protein